MNNKENIEKVTFIVVAPCIDYAYIIFISSNSHC